MADDFAVDTESLERFRAAVDRVRDRVGSMRGLAEAAGLAPGTFTLTEGGQRADAAHEELMAGIDAGIGAAIDNLGDIGQRTTATMDGYTSVDAKHAGAMLDMEGRLPSREGTQS